LAEVSGRQRGVRHQGMDIEIETLRGYLDGQRRHVLGIVDGLGEAELRKPVLPSGWSCVVLINHLALDIERFWFRAVVAGEAIPPEGNAWHVDPGVPPSEVINRYKGEIERANAIIVTTPPDRGPKWWPDELFGGWRLTSHREVLLHVIAETACHAGHLDAARELIDGRLWRVLT
jgi:hypothetical protein